MNSDRTIKTNPKHEVAWLVRTGLLAGSLTLASLLLALGSVRFIRLGAEAAHTNLDAIEKAATDYVFQNHYESEMALSLNSMEPANEEFLKTLIESLEERWRLASEADPLVEQGYKTFTELLLSCQLIFEIKKESDEWQQAYLQYRWQFQDHHKAASKLVTDLHNINLAAIGRLRLAEASLLQASNTELDASRVALKSNIGEQMRLYRIRTDLDSLLLHVEKLASSNTVNLLPDLRENKIHPVLSSLELSFAEEPETLSIVRQLAIILFQERNSGDAMEANSEKGLYDYRRDLICLERQRESINNRTRDLMETVRKQGVAIQQLSTQIDDLANRRSEVAILVVIGVVSVVSAVSCLAFVLLARSVGNSIHEQLEALNGSNRDLKGTYEKLQKLQGQNSSFLQTTSDVVLTVDGKGRVVTANAATHEILGVMPDELIGRSIFLYVPSLSNDTAELSRDEAFGIRREVEVTHESGCVFPAEIVISLLGWEEDSLFAVLLTDASRRKYAEQQVITLGKLVEDAVNESIVFRANDSKILLPIVVFRTMCSSKPKNFTQNPSIFYWRIVVPLPSAIGSNPSMKEAWKKWLRTGILFGKTDPRIPYSSPFVGFVGIIKMRSWLLRSIKPIFIAPKRNSCKPKSSKALGSSQQGSLTKSIHLSSMSVTTPNTWLKSRKNSSDYSISTSPHWHVMIPCNGRRPNWMWRNCANRFDLKN